MKWVWWADLHLKMDWPGKAKYLDLRPQIILPGDKEGFLGDCFEGYLYRLETIFQWHPDLIQLWQRWGTIFLIGNHEWFQQEALFDTFGYENVQRLIYLSGVSFLHADQFDPFQDTTLERWLAMEAFKFYDAYPNIPVLDSIYQEVMVKHRDNTPLLVGMEKEGIKRAGFGHSHREIAWWDSSEGIDYFNPGSMADKLQALVFYPESGSLHLETFT
jgi:hypothetical protein